MIFVVLLSQLAFWLVVALAGFRVAVYAVCVAVLLHAAWRQAKNADRSMS